MDVPFANMIPPVTDRKAVLVLNMVTWALEASEVEPREIYIYICVHFALEWLVFTLLVHNFGDNMYSTFLKL